MKDLIRIKVKRNNTKIHYNKKEFSSRMEAIEGCIIHLQKLKNVYLEIQLAGQAIKNSLDSVKEYNKKK